jgi:hypothetical protein
MPGAAQKRMQASAPSSGVGTWHCSTEECICGGCSAAGPAPARAGTLTADPAHEGRQGGALGVGPGKGAHGVVHVQLTAVGHGAELVLEPAGKAGARRRNCKHAAAGRSCQPGPACQASPQAPVVRLGVVGVWVGAPVEVGSSAGPRHRQISPGEGGPCLGVLGLQADPVGLAHAGEQVAVGGAGRRAVRTAALAALGNALGGGGVPAAVSGSGGAKPPQLMPPPAAASSPPAAELTPSSHSTAPPPAARRSACTRPGGRRSGCRWHARS